MIPRPPISTLFPYTTLFRSVLVDRGELRRRAAAAQHQLAVGAEPRALARTGCGDRCRWYSQDRKSTRLNSSHVSISYAVFCLKKKKKQTNTPRYTTES